MLRLGVFWPTQAARHTWWQDWLASERISFPYSFNWCLDWDLATIEDDAAVFRIDKFGVEMVLTPSTDPSGSYLKGRLRWPPLVNYTVWVVLKIATQWYLIITQLQNLHCRKCWRFFCKMGSRSPVLYFFDLVTQLRCPYLSFPFLSAPHNMQGFILHFFSYGKEPLHILILWPFILRMWARAFVALMCLKNFGAPRTGRAGKWPQLHPLIHTPSSISTWVIFINGHSQMLSRSGGLKNAMLEASSQSESPSPTGADSSLLPSLSRIASK